jgi:cardiolipin synthase (CMP-forming)
MLRFLNPANLATLARLALAPWIALAMAHDRSLQALVLFCIAGLTDVVDGGLARHFGWSTPAGAYLDPIADKVLLSTVFLCLAVWNALPWWFVAVVFGRDVLILAAAGLALAFTRLRKFPPTVWGKLSTFLQILTAVVWMTVAAVPSFTLDSAAQIITWLATAATVWSGLHYGWRLIRLLRSH